MALSKETRIKIFLVVDIIFFLVEIILGYTAHSLALVADAFHMLNDVASLCVGLWAVRIARQKEDMQYTYGWARAEILGGLVNGVFLMALCLSIILEAIQRFVEPQEVKNPKIVLIVGAVGLAFNIGGLFIFHQHSHSHGPEPGLEHDHGEIDVLGAAEAGKSVGVETIEEEQSELRASQSNLAATPVASSPKGSPRKTAIQWRDPSLEQDRTGLPFLQRSRTGSNSILSNTSISRRRSGSRIENLPEHPASLRHAFMAASRGYPSDTEDEDEEIESAYRDGVGDDGVQEEADEPPNESTALRRNPTLNGSVSRRAIHQGHKHTQPGSRSKGSHSHSHEDMNIKGMFIHVLGDALGNIGVMASALIIWLSNWSFRFYFDPAISLLITLIILKSAIPLVLQTAKPLLQATPKDMRIDDIKSDIQGLRGVADCHHVHVWSLTPSRWVATLDVKLDFGFDSNKGAARWMELANEIKECLHGHGIHHSTVQPEFADKSKEGMCAMVCAESCGSGTATPKVGKDSGTSSGGSDCEPPMNQLARSRQKQANASSAEAQSHNHL